MSTTDKKKTPAVRQHDEGPENHVDTGFKAQSTRRVPAMCATCGSVREMSARFTRGSLLRCEGCCKRTNHYRVDRIPTGDADYAEVSNRRMDPEIAATLAEIEYSEDLLAKLGIEIEVESRPDWMVGVRRDGSPALCLAYLSKVDATVWVRSDLTLYGYARALALTSRAMASPDMGYWDAFVTDRKRQLLPDTSGVRSG